MPIVFENVAKTLRKDGHTTNVFRDLSVSLPFGRSIGILGARNSGKSTFIRLLTGITLPDSGSISRQGSLSLPVGSTRAFHSALSGRENIRFVAEVYGFDGTSVANFVERFSELGDVLDQPLSTYNREDRSRFIFSVSYGFPFDTYVADEAIIGGSRWFRDRCKMLLHARRLRSGLIFTTNKPQMLREFADIGGLISDGRITLYPRLGDAIRTFQAQGYAAGEGTASVQFEMEADDEDDAAVTEF